MSKFADIDEYLATLDPHAQAIGLELRTVIDRALPDATGVIWHAHPVWMSGKTPLAGFKAYTKYVTFMIWNGSAIADPSHRLEHSTHMSSIKIHSEAEIDAAQFIQWLRVAHPS